MRINNNITAMNTHRFLALGNTAGAKSTERLSSGFRINKAGDDAAGLAISEKMRAQIRGLSQASANAQDGISMIQTAEGALSETHSILQRMRELATQASNDTNTSVDRDEIQKEMDEMAKEITRIANNTEFNTQKLINGGIDDSGIKSTKFHVGANASQDITLSIKAMDAKSLGVSRDVGTASVGAGAVDVESATLSGNFGSAIVDEASIAVSAAEVAATAGSVTGSDVSGVFATDMDTTLTVDSFTLNGQSIALTNVIAEDGSGTAFDIDDLKAALQLDIDAVYDGTAHDEVEFTVTADGDALVITNDATGSSSEVEITANADTAALKLTADASTNASGTGTDLSYTVTLNDGTTSVDITGLDGTETSIAGTGVYEGLTLTTDGAFDENLAATVTVDADVAAAATFADQAKTGDAVAEAGLDVSTQSAASSAITTIQSAIETVSAERSKLGAYQNRLDHTIKNLETSAENLQAAESRIRDVDMAKEMMEFTKSNILQQAAQAMLAQANQAPQGVLQLLR